jgi:hypothetical protein
MSDGPHDWKLKLRYGKLSTRFRHFTVLADGAAGPLMEGFTCRPGRAWMRMKAWAADGEEAMDMVVSIGRQIGFSVDGEMRIYETPPEQPPGERPLGYDIGFTPYESEDS